MVNVTFTRSRIGLTLKKPVTVDIPEPQNNESCPRVVL